ncbi:serine/threonine-protein kinase Mec1p [Trichomonascus vanleenenianus]|uniref:protein kinase MEC1 n=1 Tax=Trichomonascus vanleenenianus TaxID=2268995 RepID=UPI003EC9F55C
MRHRSDDAVERLRSTFSAVDESDEQLLEFLRNRSHVLHSIVLAVDEIIVPATESIRDADLVEKIGIVLTKIFEKCPDLLREQTSGKSLNSYIFTRVVPLLTSGDTQVRSMAASLIEEILIGSNFLACTRGTKESAFEAFVYDHCTEFADSLAKNSNTTTSLPHNLTDAYRKPYSQAQIIDLVLLLTIAMLRSATLGAKMPLSTHSRQMVSFVRKLLVNLGVMYQPSPRQLHERLNSKQMGILVECIVFALTDADLQIDAWMALAVGICSSREFSTEEYINSATKTVLLLAMGVFIAGNSLSGGTTSYITQALGSIDFIDADLSDAIAVLRAVIENGDIPTVQFTSDKLKTMYARIVANTLEYKHGSDPWKNLFNGEVHSFSQLLDACTNEFANFSAQRQCEFLHQIGLLACHLAGNMISDTFCGDCDGSIPHFTEKRQKSPGFKGILLTLLTHITSYDPPRIDLHLAFANMLRRILASFEPEFEFFPTSQISQWIVSSFEAPSRDLRVCAGRLFPYLYLSESSTSNRAKITDYLFSNANNQSADGLETTILALSEVSLVCDGETLNAILLQLIDFLSSGHPYINSLSFSQLQAIAKMKAISCYQLFNPFWETISIDVVKRYNKSPGFLTTFVDLLGISQEEFLKRTASHTVPYLVVQREFGVIESISHACGYESLQKFYLKHISRIIAVLLMKASMNNGNPQTIASNIQMILGETKAFPNIDFQTVASPYMIEISFEVLKQFHGSNEGTIINAFKVLAFAKYPNASEEDLLEKFFNVNMVPQTVIHISDTIRSVFSKKPFTVKIQCLKGLSMLIKISPSAVIANAVPQICAILQSALETEVIQLEALKTWSVLVQNLNNESLSSVITLTFAIIIQRWSDFRPETRLEVKGLFEFLVSQKSTMLKDIMKRQSLPALNSIPSLKEYGLMFDSSDPPQRNPYQKLRLLIIRCQDENIYVVRQTVLELKEFLSANTISVVDSINGEHTKTIIEDLVRTLFDVSFRFHSSESDISLLCMECLGKVGAVDHHKLSVALEGNDFVLIHNFESGRESKALVVILLEKFLIKNYRASREPSIQLFLAWGIQELLRFCNLTPQNYKSSTLWEQFSEVSKATLYPLLSTKYSRPAGPSPDSSFPIYCDEINYSHWLRKFSLVLMSKAKGSNAEKVFGVCLKSLRDKSHGQGVLNFLLPYSALNVILTGSVEDRNCIQEELKLVLNSPIESENATGSSFRQTAFHLVDYFTKWVRERRKINTIENDRQWALHKKAQKHLDASKGNINDDEMILIVEEFLRGFSPDFLAQRSFEVKSFPRAVMYWENFLRSQSNDDNTRYEILSKFQDIYSSIDDPDSLEGIASEFPDFNIEQQILRYEGTGKWEYAIGCYEASMDRLGEWEISEENTGRMMNCLKQAGRYQDLLSRLEGVYCPHDEWVRLGTEASWMLGDTKSLSKWVMRGSSENNYEANIGNAFLALGRGDEIEFRNRITLARKNLTEVISPRKVSSLAQVNAEFVKLHGLTDLEILAPLIGAEKSRELDYYRRISGYLDSRMEVAGSDWSAKRFLFSLRKAALTFINASKFEKEIGTIWADMSKIARKQNQSGIALQASLFAQQFGSVMGKVENANVLWEQGDQKQATALLETVIDEDTQRAMKNYRAVVIHQISKDKAKIALKHATWMDFAGEEGSDSILMRYKAITKLHPRWEKVHYKLAMYYNKLFDSQAQLPASSHNVEFEDGSYVLSMVKNYLQSLQYGVKHIHETLPKVITVWLDYAANYNKVSPNCRFNREKLMANRRKSLKDTNELIRKFSTRLPAYIFYLVISQLLSRLNHDHKETFGLLKTIIFEITKNYPSQALWFVISATSSDDKAREERAREVIEALLVTNSGIEGLRETIISARDFINALVDFTQRSQSKSENNALKSTLSKFGFRKSTMPCNLAVPVQAMMTITLPSNPEAIKYHKPFPSFVTINHIEENITIQSSMQRPKRIVIVGENGERYKILCKKEDDLRKDARTMEFSQNIDNILVKDDDASKRHLRINTYQVIPLTSRSGVIEWVDGAVAFREIITKIYASKGKKIDWGSLKKQYTEMNSAAEDDKVSLFRKVLQQYPPILHEWFLETFSDPVSWLEARTRYVRTLAVMSIVGYILGLGDRHNENILFIKRTGAIMHVDFDMLFDKGLTLAIPERVPFRLTNHMVDAMGICGYEGLFRRSCEVTLKLMRANEGLLMNVLEPFLYEPFVDWTNNSTHSRSHVVINDLRVAKSPEEAFATIRKKIRGIRGQDTLPLSVSGQVEYLIKLAVSDVNLASMYVGWGSCF